ncbi:hypothetical protein A2609_03580 [Candidatus Kaiserbacteria bacterium RIFOXYD1_FULL_47_14]|uniref:Uncharacterized protein n=1 Tax=Candidatus Kaiserbacteria bacterium RIFOXYD1_FULL_47_14 TaxID=1798533 RepID=A0A1F6G3Y9_9BACT|nr:MAG: hypothetical protein A2609_03580 [Candidatus Kaiserbacteria bacterium RIFOXYD1_FULL_47_14]
MDGQAKLHRKAEFCVWYAFSKEDMSNSNNKKRLEAERRMLPFAVEFLKFCIIFAVIITVALFTLQVASASL